MSTCGYTCPQCEGKGFLDDGTVCDWCSVEVKSEKEKVASDEKEGEKSGSEKEELPSKQNKMPKSFVLSSGVEIRD